MSHPKSLLFACFVVLTGYSCQAGDAESAGGIVYHDLNGNGLRDPEESGLPGVAVSNQREIVRTDQEGRWSLPCDDDTIFFVIKPSGWATPLNAHQIPQFYYIHKPQGSPANFRYPGVAPTGPLPASINFALRPQEEPTKFQAILFGDPQPASIEEVNYIAHDVIAELIGTEAKFGVTLGDIMFDQLELFEPNNANIALIGIPWYNVIGNHDLNFDSPNDADSDETFHRFYGPNYYSFDYGAVHFLILDDVEWGRTNNKGQTTYIGGLDADQLAFIKSDLELVPDETLVVLMMHIPLTDVENRTELYSLIEQRSHALSISGHTHWHAHKFITSEDGWKGAEPHHHIVNVTVSGSWWQGEKDEVGIPHSTMRDGAPNGYSIITFDGNSHVLDFKAARQPADYQINVMVPDEIPEAASQETFVYVNVFNGSEHSTVQMRLGADQAWLPLARVEEADPSYVAQYERDRATNPRAPHSFKAPAISHHLWKATLPGGLPVGSHLIEVEATDAYGRLHRGRRVIRVVP